MFPRNVIYYGREEPLAEQVELRAGPLKVTYEGGDLRYIRLGDLEILRRVYVAIRDRNWGTVAPVFSNVQIEDSGSSFRIRYDVENRQGEIDFAWTGTITGDEHGVITFTMDGAARSTFMKNRIGFCVLHPAASAGHACRVTHVDGSEEMGRLPVEINPDQPVRPFADMASLAYEAAPGLWAEVTFRGDLFEMEDQRNWTDASFKTYSTPLSLPYPAEITTGTRVTQSITLALRGELPAAAAPADGGEQSAVTLAFDPADRWQPLPRLGLGVSSREEPLSERAVQRLRALNLHHLRVDLPLSDPSWQARLTRAAAEAQTLDVGLEAALIVSEEMDAELTALRRVLDAAQPPVCSWIVYPAQENYLGGSPTEAVLRAARQHLADWSPGVPFATGSNQDFIYLQRTPQPMHLADRLSFALNPQVHAFDNASIVETLEAQTVMAESARKLAQGKPVQASPITLKPRHNPYATVPASILPPGALPPQVDPRQMSLFGAAWTLGSLRAMTAGAVSSATYYETTGWRGVMETESGSPSSGFRSTPGMVFPLYHVFAVVADFVNGEALPLRSSQPLAITGLALRHRDRQRVLLANLSPHPQTVRLKGFPELSRLRMLDETTFGQDLSAQPAHPFRGAEIQLRPYALACLDAE